MKALNIVCQMQKSSQIFRHNFSRLTGHALQNKPACHLVHRAATQASAGVPRETRSTFAQEAARKTVSKYNDRSAERQP